MAFDVEQSDPHRLKKAAELIMEAIEDRAAFARHQAWTTESLQRAEELATGAADYVVQEIAVWAGDPNGWNDRGLESAIQRRFGGIA